MHCKYLSVVPYKALEKFSKALYGTTGSTYSAQVFRPVMHDRASKGYESIPGLMSLTNFFVCMFTKT